jgi:hypothetical protein
MMLCPLIVLAASPSIHCRATLGPTRVLVSLQLGDFFDFELQRLVRLGLEGHIRFELKLVQRRRLWLDETISTNSTEVVIGFVGGKYMVDGQKEVEDLSRFTLDRTSLPLGADRSGDGNYRVEAKAELQVVTAASLGKAASWLAPGSSSEETSAGTSFLAQGLLRTVAQDMARTAETTCPVETRR